jgi:lipoprotein-anchoring transpeptidase ErfK/SrfK
VTDDELERLLGGAFDAQARSAVPDGTTPPPMRESADELGQHRHRQPASRSRWLAPLAAAAVILVIAGTVFAIARFTSTNDKRLAGPPALSTSASDGPKTSSSSSTSPSSSTSTKPPKPAKPVHVSLKFGDGQTLGVGMPIIAFLSRPITDARGFAKATKVTVDGRVVHGGWYFERKYGDPGHPIEADYRLQHYWPAHARIHLSLPVKGVSAGKNLAFQDDLTLDFATGDARIVTVDAATHKLSVTDDGRAWGTFPVSLGADATRTRRGIKVIMEKYPTTCMHDTNGTYYECGIKLDQRLTYDGEYLHSAPWNIYNITHGIDSSNGCTNLLPADAQRLYSFLDVGDPVQYPNADGSLMQIGDGYGDWNVSWPQWLLGGLYRTS